MEVPERVPRARRHGARGLIRGADICHWGNHRYRLWRYWDSEKPVAGFVMLNPSTADAKCDDPTIKKCMRFAKSWGYGGIEVCNLFAWRATDKSEIMGVTDPIGLGNDVAIDALFSSVPKVVAAWGNDGSYKDRSYEIAEKYAGKFHVLLLNKTGEPSHPLFLSENLRPKPWN